MKRCFVISPIGPEKSEIREHADDVYNFIIKPAMDECGIEALRSDQLVEPGRISDQMFRSILTDDLCVAVLTGHNPNVFYELAVAQTAGRPVVMLIQKGQVLPFDIHDLRCIYYDFRPGSLGQYVKELIGHIKSFESKGWEAPSILNDYASLISSYDSSNKFKNSKGEKNDIFVSSPMTSVDPHEFAQLKDITIAAISKLRESGRFNIVYYAGQNIENIDQADPSSISAEQDLSELRASKHFMLIYPRPLVTSSLVEAGYALALNKQSVYFVRRPDDLPYMLREAAQSYPNVRTFTYRDKEHLLVLIEKFIKTIPTVN